jgi:hypothetical protein
MDKEPSMKDQLATMTVIQIIK